VSTVKALIYEEASCSVVSTLPKEDIWLRIVGPQHGNFLQELGKYYTIHELNLEDVMANHLPKYEYHEHYSLLILKTFLPETEMLTGKIAQISLIFSKTFLISFESETEQLPFISEYFLTIADGRRTPTIERIVYDLMDRIVDNYLECAYDFQDKLGDFEGDFMDSTDIEDLNALFSMRRDVYAFKKTVRPVVDIVEKQHRTQSSIFSDEMIPYMKDLWDHALRASQIADGLWETLISLHSELLTLLQYKLSKTMNLMTTVSVIFLPLMLITGIYGMNFDNMPELHWKYGYFLVMLIIVAVGVLLFFLFKVREQLK
jgi:magnesium transporter